jgi:hypothetical protein
MTVNLEQRKTELIVDGFCFVGETPYQETWVKIDGVMLIATVHITKSPPTAAEVAAYEKSEAATVKKWYFGGKFH